MYFTFVAHLHWDWPHFRYSVSAGGYRLPCWAASMGMSFLVREVYLSASKQETAHSNQNNSWGGVIYKRNSMSQGKRGRKSLDKTAGERYGALCLIKRKTSRRLIKVSGEH